MTGRIVVVFTEQAGLLQPDECDASQTPRRDDDASTTEK